MKRIVSACLVCALLLSSTGLRVSAANQPELGDYENGEVLALYRDGSCAVYTYEDEAALSAGLDTLAKDTSIEWLQPNYTYQAAVLSVNDTMATRQWALSNDGDFRVNGGDTEPVYDTPVAEPQALDERSSAWNKSVTDSMAAAYNNTAAVQAVAGIDINVETAWSLYSGGSRDVVIALIDTGVDSSHEDFSDILWVNSDEIPNNGIDDDGNGYIDDVNGWNFYSNNNKTYVGSEDGHGTHGAGTILATANNGKGIAGIVQSDHVKIMVLKALGGMDGEGSTASIIEAIRYAEANGADICNLSLGSERNDQALYRTMASSSMLFVAAAGNDSRNTDRSPSYPACYDLDNIISVANLNCNGSLHSSSNYGAVSVDLAAPGSYIYSTTTGNSYEYLTGTSMSAPMVTAAAAMLYSHFADSTLADVRTILLSTAKKQESLTNVVATGGMLDLGAAMSWSGTFGRSWTEETAEGSAPSISVWHMYYLMGQIRLFVTVKDPDGDLQAVAWEEGIQTADYFKGGTAGIPFSLDFSGSAIFSATRGVYTFYAIDAAGHETVVTYTV